MSIWTDLFQSSKIMTSFNMHYTRHFWSYSHRIKAFLFTKLNFAILYFVSVAINNVLPMAGRGKEIFLKEK